MLVGNECERDLLIGYGTVSIFGIIPQSVLLMDGSNPVIIIACSAACNLAPIPIYFLFIFKHFKTYKPWDFEKSYDFVRDTYNFDKSKPTINYKFKIILIHFVISICISFLNCSLGSYGSEARIILWLPLFYAVVFSWSTAEFLAISKFGLEKCHVVELNKNVDYIPMELLVSSSS